MKKKVNSGSDANNGDASKQKERHIVSWSQEEDDILREQIRLHGTENWAIIASKFKDKTTRQCRRRWFTYLNSDFKKGGWSPEEDVLLCEAQKIFGNRWTEIAKVVSGRTDNAVKNRFTTLCKKRAKHEALAKENSTSSYINLNNKRVIFPNGLNAGGSESAAPLKKMRAYVLNTAEIHGENLSGECGNADHLLRPPFSVLAQNVDSSGINKSQGTFLKKDDPKVLALMQQAELLSSLAIKVNSEKTDQSLESAWMALQDFLKQNKESDLFTLTNPDVDLQLEKFKDFVEDLTNDDEGSRPSWREPDLYESSTASSEYSAGSTLLPIIQGDKADGSQAETCLLHQENGHQMQPDQLDHQQCLAEGSQICQTASTDEVNMLTCNNTNNNDEAVCEYSSTEFGSPLHVTPLFGALAATIPSPKFSESEKHFLMKALGMESTSPSHVANASQPPPCKRSLLHCL
ncbi:transcription factor MYB124-like isoform X1 [Salvia splendens]|uniref:transcription factor MYB124-like isoform X1 n=1 Tax=Salvia splendens TaxID=180675 RepID=UPI001C262D35|nr:transcription factor MYB124-like isoform X1 [Salvia splendens]